MTRLFLDTNIVIDLLERREPFCHDAVRLFTMAYKKTGANYRVANDVFNGIFPSSQTRP
jgi:predicted nucleic acid-binding protein